MPANVVKSYAEKTGKSVAEIEKYWNEAKKAAEGEKGKGEKAYYGTIMTIFKAKLKKHVGLSEGRLQFDVYVGVINESIEDANFADEFINEGRAKEKNVTVKDVDIKELEMGIKVEYLNRAVVQSLSKKTDIC